MSRWWRAEELDRLIHIALAGGSADSEPDHEVVHEHVQAARRRGEGRADAAPRDSQGTRGLGRRGFGDGAPGVDLDALEVERELLGEVAHGRTLNDFS